MDVNGKSIAVDIFGGGAPILMIDGQPGPPIQVLLPFLRESIMRQSVEGHARTGEALAGALPADADQIRALPC